MLIDFSFSNFRSFRDEQSFSNHSHIRRQCIRKIQFPEGDVRHAQHGDKQLQPR